MVIRPHHARPPALRHLRRGGRGSLRAQRPVDPAVNAAIQPERHANVCQSIFKIKLDPDLN